MVDALTITLVDLLANSTRTNSVDDDTDENLFAWPFGFRRATGLQAIPLALWLMPSLRNRKSLGSVSDIENVIAIFEGFV